MKTGLGELWFFFFPQPVPHFMKQVMSFRKSPIILFIMIAEFPGIHFLRTQTTPRGWSCLYSRWAQRNTVAPRFLLNDISNDAALRASLCPKVPEAVPRQTKRCHPKTSDLPEVLGDGDPATAQRIPTEPRSPRLPRAGEEKRRGLP